MHWAHAWQKRVCARFTLLLEQREGIAASRRAATLNRVLRIVPALGHSITAAALLLGCGHSSISPSKPAPPADVETRIAPQKQPRELPRLLAPPPKYGNKIVMARAGSSAERY